MQTRLLISIVPWMPSLYDSTIFAFFPRQDKKDGGRGENLLLPTLLACSGVTLKTQDGRRHLDDHGAGLRGRGAGWQGKGGSAVGKKGRSLRRAVVLLAAILSLAGCTVQQRIWFNPHVTDEQAQRD